MQIPFAEKLKAWEYPQILWVLALSLNIITFLLIYFKIHPKTAPLALHYNVLTGVDLFGKGTDLYKLPTVGLIILAVNFILGRLLRRQQDFLAFLPAMVSLLAATVVLAAALFLFRVN